jgi:hypothetical protein
MTSYTNFEALKAQQIRDVLVQGIHSPCPDCAARKPVGGVLPDQWTLVITTRRAGINYTTHTPDCSLAPWPDSAPAVLSRYRWFVNSALRSVTNTTGRYQRNWQA